MNPRFRRWLVLAFLLSTQLTVALTQAAEVVVKRHAVIRTEPRSSSRRLGAADPGERFPLLSDSLDHNWYKIEFEGDSGWIYSRWVDLVEVTPSENIRIATFNTLHLGWNNNKDLELVAAVLEHYDIIALEEVMKREALEELKQTLDSLLTEAEGIDVSWNYVLSEALGRSRYKESYAFIWRNDRVQMSPGSDSVVNDDADRFIREPFVATFESGNFDFTLICAHFASESQGKRMIIDEARAMADVFENLQDQDASENDIILLGDFNLSSRDNGWDALKNISGMHWVLNPPTKTSIGYTRMSRLFDNIWFQTQHVTEYSGESGTYEFMHDLFDDDIYNSARAHVSDHVPVYAVFRIDQADDD